MSNDRILRPKPAGQYLGIARSTIYAKLDKKSPAYDPTFPKPIRLGARAVGFEVEALDAWVDSLQTVA